MNLCKYKNALGQPKKGIHSYRIFNIAIADVIMTLIAAVFISYIFKLSYFRSAILLFILGIILHQLFCVRTTVNTFLFP